MLDQRPSDLVLSCLSGLMGEIATLWFSKALGKFDKEVHKPSCTLDVMLDMITELLPFYRKFERILKNPWRAQEMSGFIFSKDIRERVEGAA